MLAFRAVNFGVVVGTEKNQVFIAIMISIERKIASWSIFSLGDDVGHFTNRILVSKKKNVADTAASSYA